MQKIKQIYADNAATTPMSNTVINAIKPYINELYANPSSLYSDARKVRNAIENAREIVAKYIGAKPSEIYFTSGGTESNNWAIKSLYLEYYFGTEGNMNHIITSQIEHPSVLRTCGYLESIGANVTYLPVDNMGFVNPKDLEKALTNRTTLVSIMSANNEIGTIQPLKKVGNICKSAKVYFHTDAVQVFGKHDINVEELNVDMLTISGHKIHAPKGVGALYVKDRVEIDPFIHGGAQENGYRTGTENVTGIIGLGQAVLDLQTKSLAQKKTLVFLRDNLCNKLLTIPNSHINGSFMYRLHNNISITFKGIRADALVLALDLNGIQISAGSACSAHGDKPSHVLKAIGLSDEEAASTVRITLGDDVTMNDTNIIADEIGKAVIMLRKIGFVKDLDDEFLV